MDCTVLALAMNQQRLRARVHGAGPTGVLAALALAQAKHDGRNCVRVG